MTENGKPATRVPTPRDTQTPENTSTSVTHSNGHQALVDASDPFWRDVVTDFARLGPTDNAFRNAVIAFAHMRREFGDLLENAKLLSFAAHAVLEEKQQEKKRLLREVAKKDAALDVISERLQLKVNVPLPALAMAILFDRPDISVEELAKTLGVNRSTIYRSPKWKNVRLTFTARMGDKDSLPKGRKVNDGRIEAETPPQHKKRHSL